MAEYGGPGIRVDRGIVSRVKRMQTEAYGRDIAHERVLAVRRGEFASLWPDQFSEQYPTAIVANFVDVAARDIARKLSPLPGLACSAGNMKTEADKRRAEKLNRIGVNYWRESLLDLQMMYGADQYLTYGFEIGWVEADFDRQMPIIKLEDPRGAYYKLNRWFEVEEFARVWRQSHDDLCAQFPEYTYQITHNSETGAEYMDTDTEVVRWVDGTVVMLYLPDRGNLCVASYEHGMGYPPVVVAPRPGVEVNPRGQFDDVLWVQLAHAVMAALTLEAGHKSVQAPLAMPSDVQEIPVGPDAIIVTDSPEKVQRIALNVPSAAFALTEQLSSEMHDGAGYPATRTGNAPPGGITGRGVSALEGGLDDQIGQGQTVLGRMVRRLTEMSFDMDLKMWPNKRMTIAGSVSGESFEITYQPKTDLAKKPRCEVSYGFAAGLSPNASIVTLLQLRGDEIISRDMFRRQLPFDIDVTQAQRELDVQVIEDGYKQGLSAMLQSAGQLIASGQMQTAVDLFASAAHIVEGRREGKDLTTLFMEAFQPPAPQAQPGMPGQPGAPGGASGEGLPGVGPDGLPQGVAPGQAGMPPGGRASVTDLVAGFTGGGKANVGATIHRRLATG